MNIVEEVALSNYEKETTINYNDAEKSAECYTCNKALMNKLDKLCILHHDNFKLLAQDKHSKTYFIANKKLISIRTPKIYTEEQLTELRERIKRNFNR